MLCSQNKTHTSWYLLVVLGRNEVINPYPKSKFKSRKKEEGEKRGKECETGGGGGQLVPDRCLYVTDGWTNGQWIMGEKWVGSDEIGRVQTAQPYLLYNFGRDNLDHQAWHTNNFIPIGK